MTHTLWAWDGSQDRAMAYCTEAKDVDTLIAYAEAQWHKHWMTFAVINEDGPEGPMIVRRFSVLATRSWTNV